MLPLQFNILTMGEVFFLFTINFIVKYMYVYIPERISQWKLLLKLKARNEIDLSLSLLCYGPRCEANSCRLATLHIVRFNRK